MKRAERRNRDEFRKMMEEHVAAGTLTAKTHWRDYCLKVCPRLPDNSLFVYSWETWSLFYRFLFSK